MRSLVFDIAANNFARYQMLSPEDNIRILDNSVHRAFEDTVP
jgi:hypothetical protein